MESSEIELPEVVRRNDNESRVAAQTKHEQAEDLESREKLLQGDCASTTDPWIKRESHPYRNVQILPASEIQGKKSPPSSKKQTPRRETTLVGAGLLLVILMGVVVFVTLTLKSERAKKESLVPEGFVETVIGCGKIRGKVEDGAYSFRGLPYAVPPLGDLRWRPTVPLTHFEDCWVGLYKALESKALCYQGKAKGSDDHIPVSENCLYLDVFTPSLNHGQPLPVVVFISGNSFLDDDNVSRKLTPSAHLARKQNVVLVNIRYRLNAFGFLALKMFRQRNLLNDPEMITSGNYGLHDIITALNWVRTNVDNFGGNPQQVTIFGHGSGGTAILALISSPLAQGLFNNAWVSGGSADFANFTLEEVEEHNEAFLSHFRCEDGHCLGHSSSEEVYEAASSLDWWTTRYWDIPNINENSTGIPVVDGVVLQDLPSRMMHRGQLNDVNLVIGASAYELRGAPPNLENWTLEQILGHVQSRFSNFGPNLAQAAVQRYFNQSGTGTANTSGTPISPFLVQYAKMVSDVRIVCPLMNLAQTTSKKFLNVVRAYVTTYLPSTDQYLQTSTDSRHMLSPHWLDTAAILGQMDMVLGEPKKFKMTIFENIMQDLFFGFVRNANLEGGTAPPGYLEIFSGERYPTPRHGSYPNCDFWTESGLYPKYAHQN